MSLLFIYFGIGVVTAVVIAYLAGEVVETGGPWMLAAVLLFICLLWPAAILAMVYDTVADWIDP